MNAGTGWLTRHGALRVPEITVYFWVIKALSTAMGESTSDYSVHAIDPVIAVVLGFCGFVAALALQFSVRRYIAWTYWLAVVGVGVFGTMAADVLHVRFGVPYAASSALYSIVLLVVFVSWDRTEKTLSFHTIDTPRREAFYWAAVVATFAMGTAVGDLTATTLGLGYFASGLLFAGLIAVPAVGYWRLGWNGIFSFWFAYVATAAAHGAHPEASRPSPRAPTDPHARRRGPEASIGAKLAHDMRVSQKPCPRGGCHEAIRVRGESREVSPARCGAVSEHDGPSARAPTNDAGTLGMFGELHGTFFP